jgi:hypothetical protein
MACRGEAAGVRDGYLRGSLPRIPTPRQVEVLSAFVAAGSVAEAAARVGVRPSTAKRHLADLRARSGLTTEQLIYRGRSEGWLVVPSLDREHPFIGERQDRVGLHCVAVSQPVTPGTRQSRSLGSRQSRPAPRPRSGWAGPSRHLG